MTKRKLNDICGHCAFYESSEHECRRFPPQIKFSDSGSTNGSDFPHVSPLNWCGEFKRETP